MKKTLITSAPLRSVLGALILSAGFAGAASAADVGACLITKTDNNPFFVKMKEGRLEEGGGARHFVQGLCRQDRRRQ